MSGTLNPPCPLLPTSDRETTFRDVAALGKDRGPAFYEVSMHYAQALWQAGLPAQALLQLNRALSCWLPHDEPILRQWPLPYRTMFWLINERRDGQFLGNPRRHFQHLATRMVEPHKDLRTWRAWACWYGAKSLLPEAEFPSDWKQIRAERIVEPTFHTIERRLCELSPANDAEVWTAALVSAGIALPAYEQPVITIIGKDQLPAVRDLAHAIWPRVYPGIITMEQISYMLEQRYALDVLAADMDRGALYALVSAGADTQGYLSFEPRTDTGDVFLHKLYLLPEAAGKGLGAAALAYVTKETTARGLNAVRLCVNKYNTNAVRAYLRAGFEFEYDVVTDIGDGFVMDDFQMILRLQ